MGFFFSLVMLAIVVTAYVLMILPSYYLNKHGYRDYSIDYRTSDDLFDSIENTVCSSKFY